MNTTSRVAALAATLMLVLAVQPTSAVILQTFDLGLTGTFVHGQEPVSSDVDLGLGFIHTELILRITATGVPGYSSSLGEIPAEIVVSATGDDGLQWFSQTVFGPFDDSPSTQLEENSFYVITLIWPPPVYSAFGEVVIQTHDIYPDVVTPPVIEITHASISSAAPGAAPLDLDGDTFVGLNDLNVVLSNWNQFVSLGDYQSGDCSEDGFIGIEDLNYVLANWNAGTPPPPPVAVPEPAALAMLGGVCLLAMGRRR